MAASVHLAKRQTYIKNIRLPQVGWFVPGIYCAV